MSVLSNSNMQILWEVLNGMISENKLNINDKKEFKSYFDNKCREYHVKRFDFSGLSDINKHIVSECFEYLKTMSRNSKLLMFREYEQYGNKKVINNIQIDKRYEEHQTNFKSMINAKRPNEIDFAENMDKPIGNMDDIMSKRMKERNADIHSIKNEYNQNHESIKWLNNSGGDIPPKLVIHDEPMDNSEITNNFLNKGSEIKKVEEKPKKKVKFKSDFLNTIEKKSNDIDDNELKEKAATFQNLTEMMNKDNEKKSNVYIEKREIIDIIHSKEEDEKNGTKEEKEDDTNLFNIFSKMKKKTETSDIEGSQKVDLIDIHKRLDKLETYLVDILKNQINLMDQQKNILSKIQYNEMDVGTDVILPTFSAI